MEDIKKIYLSAMVPSELLDDDNDLTQSEVVGDSLIQYEFEDLLDNIGSHDFKETYNIFIDDIRKQSFDNQYILCQHILNKIENVYNFRFPENIHLDSISDFDDIYKFVNFIEFDNFNFLIDILKDFNVGFIKEKTIDFFDKNSEEIIKKIEMYNKINLPVIFNNLIQTLENKKIIYIINKMILKSYNIISNELRIREFLIRSE